MENTSTNKDVWFSVIVPVYNVEAYLEQCVNSVLNQTSKDFELILVDDGSLDNSGKMCDDYAAVNDNIRVIHKKNGGLSSARNAGIEVARGKYVIFLDSDDFWDDKDALMNMSCLLKRSSADMLLFFLKRFYEDSNQYTYTVKMKVDKNVIRLEDDLKVKEYLIQNNLYRAAAVNKVVKRDILISNKLFFKEGILSEDMDWCGDLLLICKKFDYYDSAFYCYRQNRKGSITSGKNEKLVSDKMTLCNKGMKQTEHLTDKMKSILGSYYAYEYSVALGVSLGVHDKKTLERMKKLSVLLDYDICDKVKKVNRIKRIFGYSLTRYILCLFVFIKK